MTPGLYSMVGAAACLAGVTRMTGMLFVFYHSYKNIISTDNLFIKNNCLK